MKINKNSLKALIKDTPTLYASYLFLKSKNKKAYIDKVIGLENNPDLIEVEPGEGQAFCYITMSSPTEGLGASLRWTLAAIAFCDAHGLIPIVKFCEDSLYRDSNMPNDMNPFDYYFKMDTNCKKTEKGHPEVKYLPRNNYFAESLNQQAASYNITPEYIKLLGEAMRKHIKLNNSTQAAVTEYIKNNGINERCLGVHIRGTDYKVGYKRHPIYIGPEDYFPVVDQAMESGGYDSIYLATDDAEILDVFTQRYADRLLCDKGITRAVGNVGVHVQTQSNKYQLGVEVLCDIYALAACGGIISGLSQVSLVARVVKEAAESVYKTDIRLSKGINENGKTFSI